MATTDEPQRQHRMGAAPRRAAETAPPALALDLLGGIASGLARSRATWEPLVAFADDEVPTVELLLPSNRYDVFVESWGPGHDITIDDRGSCAVTVVAGALVLTVTRDGQRRADVVAEGQTFVIGPDAPATLRNLGPARAVSIHAIEHGLQP